MSMKDRTAEVLQTDLASIEYTASIEHFSSCNVANCQSCDVPQTDLAHKLETDRAALMSLDTLIDVPDISIETMIAAIESDPDLPMAFTVRRGGTIHQALILARDFENIVAAGGGLLHFHTDEGVAVYRAVQTCEQCHDRPKIAFQGHVLSSHCNECCVERARKFNEASK